MIPTMKELADADEIHPDLVNAFDEAKIEGVRVIDMSKGQLAFAIWLLKNDLDEVMRSLEYSEAQRNKLRTRLYKQEELLEKVAWTEEFDEPLDYFKKIHEKLDRIEDSTIALGHFIRDNHGDTP